jgi:rhodanese-related sulfurtransferase
VGKALFGALLLIGLGVVGGYVHAKNRGVVLKLPENPPQAAPATADKPGPAPAQAPKPPAPEAPKPFVPETPVKPLENPVKSPESTPPAQQPAQAAPPATPENDWFITAAQAKELYDKKSRGEWDGYFLDARPYNEYMDGHIPGAMALDKNKMLQPKVRNYLKGMPVIIYCHGETCTDSEAVAKRLIALKYNIGPIKIIKDGWPGWQKGGYPIDKGHEVGFD